MKNRTLSYFLSAVIVLLMVACGGGGGVPLGAFPDMTATEGDPPMTLKAPTSKSPATFVYSSSNPNVATVSGNTVTILQVGTTTITAAQPSSGSYNPTSTSALLTVKPRICTAPQVNVGGVCVASVTCVAPATNQNNVCVAPTTAGNFVNQNGHSWMPVTFIDTWDKANSFCTGTTINGMTGWKLPTQFDLTELFASGAMNGQGWTLGPTWSSSAPADPVNTYYTVNLINNASQATAASIGAYVTCIR